MNNPKDVSRRSLFGLRSKRRSPSFSLKDFYAARSANPDEKVIVPRRALPEAADIVTTKKGSGQ